MQDIRPIRNVVAGQFLYGVRRGTSSLLARGSGNQVLGRTREMLSEEDCRLIEGRLNRSRQNSQCHRHLAFSLNDGRLVAGRITPDPTPDSFGRLGKYWAHLLVFDRRALAHFSRYLLRWLSSYPFWDGSANLTETPGFTPCDLPPVVLSDEDLPKDQILPSWPTQDEWPIFARCLHRHASPKNDERLVVRGDSQNVLRFIHRMEQFLPHRVLLENGFDTQADGLPKNAAHCFLRGEAPTQGASARTESEEVVVDPPQNGVSREPASAFLGWYEAITDHPERTSLLGQRDAAFELFQWAMASSDTASPMPPCSPQVAESLAPILRHHLRALVRARSLWTTPAQLLELAMDASEIHPTILFRNANDGLRPGETLSLLHQLSDRSWLSTLDANATQWLAAVAEAHGDAVMRVIVACATGDDAGLARSVCQLSDESYAGMLRERLRGSQSYTFFVDPDRIALFARTGRSLVEDGGADLRKLVHAIVAVGGEAALDELVPLVLLTAEEELRDLLQIPYIRGDTSSPFSREVTSKARALGILG